MSLRQPTTEHFARLSGLLVEMGAKKSEYRPRPNWILAPQVLNEERNRFLEESTIHCSWALFVYEPFTMRMDIHG